MFEQLNQSKLQLFKSLDVDSKVKYIRCHFICFWDFKTSNTFFDVKFFRGMKQGQLINVTHYFLSDIYIYFTATFKKCDLFLP
jgi:hypothetical protein